MIIRSKTGLRFVSSNVNMQVNMQVNALSVCRVRERDIQRVHVCFSLLRKNKSAAHAQKSAPNVHDRKRLGERLGTTDSRLF